jgi:predicted esterase
MLAIALLAALQEAKALPPLPKAEAAKLAALLENALVDPKAAGKLEAAARGWQAKHDFDSLIAALREGPALPAGKPKARGKGKKAEQLEEFGSVLYGFTFEHDGESFRYGVDVPKGYDGRERVPLLLDPGHGTGAKLDARGKADFLPFYRGQLDAAGLDHALVARTEIVEQIGADGLRGARPEDEVAQVFDAFFRDIASRFAIDLDRVWASGLSQTGFWSWELAHQRADRFAGIAPMSAVSIQQQHYLANFLHVSVYILHGDEDKICPVAQPRSTIQALEQLGVRAKLREIAGAGHDGKVWGQLSDGLAWIAERPRERYPKTIAKALQTTREPWCYWLRVDEISKPGSGEAGAPAAASVAAEIVGQEVRITSKGVEHLTLALSSELLDLGQPVVVLWNGKKVHERAVERDFAVSVRLALEKTDWSASFEAAIEL